MATQGSSASSRVYPVHENIIEGVETTMPAHLIGPTKWRTQHNMRSTPTLKQIPRKVVEDTIGTADIRWIGQLSSNVAGYGKTLLMSPTDLTLLDGTSIASGLNDNSFYRRWAMTLYDGTLYYTNDLNELRAYNGSSDAATGGPAGRYLVSWYDHMVLGYPTVSGSTYPNRVMISHLYDFATWTPDKTNEADFYDLVEWQQTDYPFVGITGLGKLRGTLWMYTPTAIVPLRYVGLPKVIQVEEEGIVTRIGNTFPWTLVCLDNVHFFYDGIEQMFWAFDGQTPQPIGEPVRAYLQANLNTDLSLASKMYGFVDVDNREVWWPFVSTASSGPFDKAVVFNYRYKRWFTASVEDVQSFCGGVRNSLTVGQLTGLVSGLTGLVGVLGLGQGVALRLFGSSTGQVLREEVVADDVSLLLPADNPVLESGDFHYGDIRTEKENDQLTVNATWDQDENPEGFINVRVKGRPYLGDDVVWTDDNDSVGQWKPTYPDQLLTYRSKVGRVLRYHFEAENIRGLVFNAFSEGIYVKQAEK